MYIIHSSHGILVRFYFLRHYNKLKSSFPLFEHLHNSYHQTQRIYVQPYVISGDGCGLGVAACADTVCISFSVNYLAVLRIRMDLWSNSVSIRNCLRRKSGAVDRGWRGSSQQCSVVGVNVLWCCRPAHYVASVYILLFCIYVCELISYAAIWEYASAETLRPGPHACEYSKDNAASVCLQWTRGWRVTGQYIYTVIVSDGTNERGALMCQVWKVFYPIQRFYGKNIQVTFLIKIDITRKLDIRRRHELCGSMASKAQGSSSTGLCIN